MKLLMETQMVLTMGVKRNADKPIVGQSKTRGG
jgi:hypothetical protein